jgi:hypothetical protein
VKKIILLIIPLALLIVGIIIAKGFSQSDNLFVGTNSPTPTLPVEFTAKFEIYTLGTKRIFTDKKYHNLSEDVFITLPDPSLVYVKKDNLSWKDFFATLPMELTQDCITTGTKQNFCTNDKNKLRFLINKYEEPYALIKEIKPNDFLLVIYE